MCYAEVVIEASVNVVRRDEAFWLTESDWCFKKVFHTVFDVLVTWSFFVSNSLCFWRKGKCFTLLSQSAAFFFQQISYLRRIFVNRCPQKNIYIAKRLLLWKKDFKIKAERRQKHWRQKRVVFQKTFWTSPQKRRKFRRYYILSLFGQWNQSKEFSKQLSFSGSKVHPLKRNIKDRQRIFFLFVDWANWKFFFCGRNVSCLSCSFLPLKEHF